MDLIYTNASGEDQGIMSTYAFDLSFGASENDFEISAGVDESMLEFGAFVYMEGTEYGGTVDTIKTSTNGKTITYRGRTWHGIMNSKVIEPDPGDNYFVVSGDANEVLSLLVARLGLSDIFVADEKVSGVNIPRYQFARYCKAYDGIRAMLAANGAKLRMKLVGQSVQMSAEPIADYTDAPVDGDIATLTVEQTKKKVNHLICLGKGDLAEREVIHLYVDQSGGIGKTQYFTGFDEYVDTYDNSNSNDLEADGIERLKELQNNDKAEIAISEQENLSYDIGDIVGAIEYESGVKVAATVAQKIVKIKNGVVSIEYKTGERSVTSSSSGGGGGSSGGGGGSVSVDDVVTETLLWQNANPTSSFEAQTISVPLAEYDMYKILYAPSTGYSTREMSMDARVGNGCVLIGMWADTDSIFHRSVSNSTTGLSVANAYVNKEKNNAYCIPLAIYGIKIVDVNGVGGGSSGGTSIELPVSIANGGTGATTAEAARANLGAYPNCVSITASGKNLDDYTEPGWYYFKEAPTGIPGGVNGWLQVANAPGMAGVKQIWYRFGTPGTNDYQTWVRTYSPNGGWGSWRRFMTADDAFLTAKTLSLTTATQTSYEMTTLAAYSRSGIVDVHINTRPETVSSSWLTVATLPSGYRPPVNIYKVESYYNTSSNYANLRLRITTAGAVQLCLGTAGANYAFHATFIAA